MRRGCGLLVLLECLRAFRRRADRSHCAGAEPRLTHLSAASSAPGMVRHRPRRRSRLFPRILPGGGMAADCGPCSRTAFRIGGIRLDAERAEAWCGRASTPALAGPTQRRACAGYRRPAVGNQALRTRSASSSWPCLRRPHHAFGALGVEAMADPTRCLEHGPQVGRQFRRGKIPEDRAAAPARDAVPARRALAATKCVETRLCASAVTSISSGTESSRFEQDQQPQPRLIGEQPQSSGYSVGGETQLDRGATRWRGRRDLGRHRRLRRVGSASGNECPWLLVGSPPGEQSPG